MILLIDHDDSFVHILSDYLAISGEDARVVRASALSLNDVEVMAPKGIVLSPGPGAPEECVLSSEVVAQMGQSIPILGVCLGHQIIAHVFGARVSRASHPLHGMTSAITHDQRTIFRGIPVPTIATRYHSLAVEADTIPAVLEVSATADDGETMGLRHRQWPVEGVQFHPESILTSSGPEIIRNWVEQLR